MEHFAAAGEERLCAEWQIGGVEKVSIVDLQTLFGLFSYS